MRVPILWTARGDSAVSGSRSKPFRTDDMAFNLLRTHLEAVMRYIVAWMLGVPFSVIALWYVVGHAACGR